MSTAHDILARQAAALLARRHARLLRPGEEIEIRFSAPRGARRVELRLHDRMADELLELFADVPELEDEEAIALGLDFLDGVLEEILEGGREAWPPLDPAPYSFAGCTLYLSGGVRRPALEAAADALLAQADGEGEP